MPAISDSSPLILYASISRLDLLQGVYGEILIPEAVWQEVVTDGAGRPGAAEVSASSWIRTHASTQLPIARALSAELGPGEAEAIAVTLELGGRIPLLLDDRKARRRASEYRLNVIGTAAVLLLAKDRGLIALIPTELQRLRAAGMFLSDETAHELLRAAGESPPE